MRLVQTALLSATLLASATSAAAMTRPPSDTGGSSGGTSVPEPGALAMMGTGVAGYGAAVALYRRKKRNEKR
ncbi:PEP-CTERM sorting domain-containing protein [Qipengyuania sp. NPDC077410]|uniref:PEP-CTERM sorting domain-containing protein n=1 Tax=Qipengyuania sp. NPDC077410 TaxID=3364496 RepID=UPI0037CB3D44